MWTRFHDMHSGGSGKLSHALIFIEAPIDEAKIIFQNRFDRNPERVTCTCCGPDYLISEASTLEQATAYERGCAFRETGRNKDGTWKDPGGGYYIEEPDTKWTRKKYMSFSKYLQIREALFIREKDILAEERQGELREEGFVWKE